MAEESAISWIDRQAIVGAIYRYAEHVDDGEFARAATLFAADGALRFEADGTPPTAPAIGPDAIAAVLAGAVRLHDGRPRTQHIVSNPIVEIAQDSRSAGARSYFTVFQATADLPLQAIAGGRYRDTLCRAADGWLFTERVVCLLHVGDLSGHLLD